MSFNLPKSDPSLKPPINGGVNYLMKHSSFQRKAHSLITFWTTKAHQENHRRPEKRTAGPSHTLILISKTALEPSPSMGFSRQEYWSGVPLPSPIAIKLLTKPFRLGHTVLRAAPCCVPFTQQSNGAILSTSPKTLSGIWFSNSAQRLSLQIRSGSSRIRQWKKSRITPSLWSE